jgi:serine/threonine protein kinase
MVDHDRVVAALPSYEIGSELGRGACGVVLAGQHRQLGRLVAIKQLPAAFGGDPAVRARFLAEARVLATLDHPHIVAIYDFVDHEGLCLLVMERLTGGTVWSRFHAGGFTADQSCAILLAVCAGLHHAHEHGVLHRDVKPENLMFSGEGTLKVTDLGIAKVVGGASTLATRRGEVLGTPAYIAPEQAQGYELTAATDVYAAGTVLYELLGGRLPFPADSDPATILYRHVHEQPPPLLEVAHAVPAELAAVTDRAVATAPGDRFQSAEEFGIAIASAAARTWGRGWLARTNVPVSGSGPILSAALGELAPHVGPSAPAPVQEARPRETPAPVAGDFVPVQMLHPELRDSYDSASPATAPTPPPAPAPATIAGEPGAPPPTGETPTGGLPEPQPAPSGKGRNPLLVAGAAVAVVALIAAVVAFAVAGGSDDSKEPASTVAKRPKVALVSGHGLWQELPAMPTARQQVGATVGNGSLWVAGGITNGASTAKVEGYDPVIATWTSAPDLPLPLHHAMEVSYRGDLVVIGGWYPSGSTLDANVSNRVFVLRGSSWTELPPLNAARAAGAAAVVGNKIVVAGGQANHQLVPTTEVFDGTRWTVGAPIPTPRDHLAAVSDGRYYYAIGGRELSADKNLGAFERYDPTTNTWQGLPALPTPRGGLGAAVVGHDIITAGGESPISVFGNVEAYDLTSGSWAALPPMKTPRHGLAVVADGTTLYAIGGARTPGHTHSVGTTESLDLSALVGATRWRGLPTMPTARQQVGATTSNGTLWVAGGIVNGASTAKVEGYDPVIATWTRAPDLPLPLHHAMEVTYRDELVVLGGWYPSGRTLDANVSDRVFALRDGKWTELPRLHDARAAGAAAVVGNKIVVAGGQANHELVKSTEVFDGTRWTEVAPIPTPRDHLAAASDGRYFYAVGGRVLASDKNLDAFERYDPAAGTWARLPGLPTPRGGLGAAIVGKQLVTAGGESPTGVFANVEGFDLATRSWELLPPMKTPRHGLAVLAEGTTLYAIGGAVAPGHTRSVNTNESLDLASLARG